MGIGEKIKRVFHRRPPTAEELAALYRSTDHGDAWTRLRAIATQ